MSVVAIIPARGGSERIPRKNLLPLGGMPAVGHTVRHAVEAELVDEVLVSTDDEEISAVARAHGAEVSARPASLAGPEATSESALLHVLDERGADPELVVFLQPTSPVRRPGDVDAAIRTLRDAGADSLFSAAENRNLFWQERDGVPEPLNYDPRRRRREQEMGRQWRENGSIYVFRPELLRREGSRLGGRIAVYEMDYWSSFQLDTPEDAELLEWILSGPEFRTEPEWPERIDLVVFDFDGVMTDNTLLVTSSGDEAVVCNRGDGWGVARLREAGVPMLVLSTEANPVVAARCRKLQLECVQDVPDKAGRLRALLGERGIDPAHVAFVGNDVNDLECLQLVGLPVAPADAEPAARAAARLVLSRRGGHGAVRELCDLLLARI